MANLFDINHVLGKIITLVLVIVAANFHILAGVLVLLFIISMNHYVVEGMENNDSSKESQNSSSEESQENPQENPQASSPISLFKTDNCKNGVLMKDGKEVTSDLIKESFPNISFSGDRAHL